MTAPFPVTGLPSAIQLASVRLFLYCNWYLKPAWVGKESDILVLLAEPLIVGTGT
ncbi:MAG: hypothetical protein JWR69_3945, partial [Pedosphaera sp.]|nr:hypothetical protein [Pedosphaera sp.]